MAKKIVIIDDEPDLLELVSDALRAQGFEVIGLAEARGAIEKIKQEQPDLVMLDVNLKDDESTDGYQICDRLKSDDATKQIPVIINTGDDFEKSVVQDAHHIYGAEAYIKKPFETKEVVAKVKELLKEKE